VCSSDLEAAGLPLLKEAFGKDARSLQAFYLGNWLTDVSQAVDPVAYAALRGKVLDKFKTASMINEAVTGVMAVYSEEIDRALATLHTWIDSDTTDNTSRILENIRETFDIEEEIVAIKDELGGALDAVLTGRSQTRDSRLGDFFRDAFLVVGYFMFIHPQKEGDEDRMDFDAFLKVFGSPNETQGASPGSPAHDRPGAYTQYYPFEHLDRPAVSSKPDIFAPGRQDPKQPWQYDRKIRRPGPRSKSRPEIIEPDLYSYLRDDIECTAGLLAEVDKAFSTALIDGFDDTDPNWHLTLAKLGHALHQVEDYFAHSNWVELAAGRLGPEFLDRVVPTERTRTIYNRRLRRYIDPPKGMDTAETEAKFVEAEKWVVTGSFDFMDTLISLAHLSEEALGFKFDDPLEEFQETVAEIRDTIANPKETVDEARALMRDALEFATDPRRALDDPDNAIASSAKDEYEEWANKTHRPSLTREQIERLARQIPLIAGTPPEIFAAFVNTIVLGSSIHNLAKPAMSLYDGIKAVNEFIKNPVDFIVPRLPRKISEIAGNFVKSYAKELVYENLGAQRIGCHSLLAKDHGSEPLYEYQRQCATAVHWYVVTILIRDRKDPHTPAHIDWLELLEYFLRNPQKPDSGGYSRLMRYEKTVTLKHVIRKGDQLDSSVYARSLTKRYARTSANPRDFTWRTIADANFETEGLTDKECRAKINAMLRDKSWGVPVAPPNYAFKPGIVILIPNQRPELKLPHEVTDSPEWWMEVMKNKDWNVFRGREDWSQRLSIGQLKHHELQPITGEQHEEIIKRGLTLRQGLRSDYRPKHGPGGSGTTSNTE